MFWEFSKQCLNVRHERTKSQIIKYTGNAAPDMPHIQRDSQWAKRRGNHILNESQLKSVGGVLWSNELLQLAFSVWRERDLAPVSASVTSGFHGTHSINHWAQHPSLITYLLCYYRSVQDSYFCSGALVRSPWLQTLTVWWTITNRTGTSDDFKILITSSKENNVFNSK